MDIEGKNVYITGGSKGIGRAIAARLACHRPKIALCGRDEKALSEAAAAAKEAGAVDVYAGRFDLRDTKAVLQFYAESKSRVGPPDILINNAGYNSRKAYLWEVEIDEFDSMMAVNLRAPFILMREAFSDMKILGGGHIVNILSTACHADIERLSVYTAAKKGLQGMTDVFRKEARPHNIRVTSIYPGGTDTSFRAQARPDYLRPESVAEAVYAALTFPDDLIVHHMTFRPMTETNF